MGLRRHILAVLSVTLLSLPFFTGCGDDPVSPQDRLVGTWNCTKWELTNESGTVDFMDDLDSFILTLSSAGTYSTISVEGGVARTSSGSYSATGNTITFDSADTVDYTISGNVLTLTGEEYGNTVEQRFEA